MPRCSTAFPRILGCRQGFRATLLVCVLLFISTSTLAATITVSPGESIQTAINAASDDAIDLRLMCDSPCINTGMLEGAPATDLQGFPRPYAGGVNMGAYEGCIGDFDLGNSAYGSDLLLLPTEWFQPAGLSNETFNLECDDQINEFDLLQFLGEN